MKPVIFFRSPQSALGLGTVAAPGVGQPTSVMPAPRGSKASHWWERSAEKTVEGQAMTGAVQIWASGQYWYMVCRV